MEFYVVLDQATGDVRWRGRGSASAQELADGLVAYAVPQAALVGAELDLAPVATMLLAQIDSAAEATRQQFITPGSGQMGTYLNKQAEAAAYLADAAAPTPYLTAEAAATGTTVPALAALVHATAQAWLAVDVKIEAARRGAKTAVAAATNIAAMHAAAQVDWAAVVNGGN